MGQTWPTTPDENGVSPPVMAALFGGHRTAGTPRDRDHYVYHPPVPRIPPDAAPQ